jgi:hypothetical protein
MDAPNAARKTPVAIPTAARTKPFPKISFRMSTSPGAQGDAQADLARSLADHVGEQAINSDRGQKQRQAGKSGHQVGGKTA